MIRPLVPMLTAALLLGGTAGCSDEEPSHTMGRDAGVDGGTVQADAAANMRDMADTEAPPDVGRPNTTGCEAAADPNGLCFERLGVMGSFCEQGTGRCLVDPAMMQAGPHEVIQIFDTSAHPEACESSTANGRPDPGSDIAWVELLDAGGAHLAWGAALALAPGKPPTNAYSSFAFMDGARPDTRPDGDDQRTCPAAVGGVTFHDDNVVSLGCGGSLLVGFVDGAGAPVALRPGHQVVVSEYANRCFRTPGDDDSRDVYSVYLCGSRVQVGPGGDDRGCVLRLGEGNRRGYSVVTVPAPL